MERLMDLISKEYITSEELDELYESENCSVVPNGNSGFRVGFQWYTVDINGEEYNVYVK